jgi:hypothetical protein
MQESHPKASQRNLKSKKKHHELQKRLKKAPRQNKTTSTIN